MNKELKNTQPAVEVSRPLVREDFQNLIDTGYFTINGVMFSFGDDTWNIGDSLSPETRNEWVMRLDFSPVGNEDAKLKLKLWVYSLLNPYKSIRNSKMRTTSQKLMYLKKCYSFMESKGWGSFFIRPQAYMIEAYRDWLKDKYTYATQRKCCVKYRWFLEFIEELWGLVQERAAMDVLNDFDSQKLKAEQNARITEAIPDEFYERLHDFCMETMEDETVELDYRITSAVIILFCQTGLRRWELCNMKVQPINKVMMEDRFGKPAEVKYVFANIIKSVRGSDTATKRVEVPLTKDGERAFNMLMELCKDSREKLGWDNLIVYPQKKKKTLTGSVLYEHWFLRFYAHYHKELDTFNTQDKYPMLASRCVSNLHRKEFQYIVDEYGKDTVIVYPNPTHFRKTFGTILYQNGIPVEIIARLLHHYSPRLTETFYIRPFFNQKDFAKTNDTYSSIIKYGARVLGKKSTDFMERLRNCIKERNLAEIYQTDDELVEAMSNISPLHAKEVGFCLVSDLHPCTVVTAEERLMCAFNTCPNIGFMFYDIVEHYQQMKHYEKAMELNAREGFDMAAKKEANMVRYLVKTYLEPEIAETEREIQKHGKEQIIEWYPAMKSILERFEEIKVEVMTYKKEVVA